jgi:hypothetical protein
MKVEYHSKSRIPTKVWAFGNFKCQPVHYSSWLAPDPNMHPWCPFKSCLEFDVTEIELEVALNNE